MDTNTVNEIAETYMVGSAIDSIKHLRRETGMDLMSAKNYIMGVSSVEELKSKLIADFCRPLRDQLRDLIGERDLLNRRIRDLEGEIAMGVLDTVDDTFDRDDVFMANSSHEITNAMMQEGDDIFPDSEMDR